MKRSILYIMITIAVFLIPVRFADVADLRPVQTVALYKTSVGYRIETDTEDYGEGKTVEAAFANLQETTPGVIYLDTADYFLIFQGAESGGEDMRKYFKSDVEVCSAIGQGKLKEVSKYLSVQGKLLPLHRWKTGQKLPVLDCRTERIKFM